MEEKYLFSSESVTEGHPDKLCDIISDSILDAYLSIDPDARVACEVTATTGVIIVMGEISSKANVDIYNIVRDVVRTIGYKDDKFGFNCETCAIISLVDKQSEDINKGISESIEFRNRWYNCPTFNCCYEENDKNLLGAGDQGMMFGYACDETETYIPASIYYSHKLCEQLSKVRKNNILEYLGPDGKSMVSIEYKNDKPARIDTIVISSQHLPNIPQERIYIDILNKVIIPIIPEYLIDPATRILVNPTGRFVNGGPCADTGLTGRKIIVDTYGGAGRHGGGAFSGKDPTKVDRTGAYAARYIAKNIVAAKIAAKCEVQISYAIGVANPVSINVNTFNTSKYLNEQIVDMIKNIFDLRPASLIEDFSLKKQKYRKLASYGHMGREDLNVAWEKTDKVRKIKDFLGEK